MDKIQRQDEVKKRIYKALRKGLFKKHAAISAGIGEKTFYRWLQEDSEFARQVDKSIAEYHCFLVGVLNMGAVRSPRIALKVLALRFPDEWDPKRVTKRQQYKESKSYESTQDIVATLQTILDKGHKVDENEKMTVLTATQT